MKPRRFALQKFFTAGLCAVMLFAAQVGQAISWHWLNPPPNTNSFSLQSVDSASGMFVMVGQKIVHNPVAVTTNVTSEALVSSDGTNWTEVVVGNLSNCLRKVVFLNGQYVAVGDGGLVAVSPTGTNWTIKPTGVTNDLFAVAYGMNLYVAVGATGKILASSNLVDWVQPNSQTALPLRSIAFGNSTFICALAGVSGLSYELISSNGLDWSLTGSALSGVTFGQGQFCNWSLLQLTPQSIRPVLQISANGLNWLTTTQFVSNPSVGVFVKYLNGRYFYSGYPANYYSLDGTNWLLAPFTLALSFSLTDVAFNGGGYAAVNSANIGYSGAGGFGYGAGNDGITNLVWRDLTYLTANSSNSTPGFRGVAEGNGIIVGMRGAGQAIATSTDGTNFSSVNATNPTSRAVVRFGGGVFIAAGDGATTVLQSTNGLQWFARNGGGAALNSVGYGNGLWVAVGTNGAISTSPTGLIWTTRLSGTSAKLTGIAYGNGVHVAVGAGGTVVTSPDGINWTVQYSGTLANLNDVAYGGGLFVADGNAGTIITSPDGVNWTAQNSGTTNNLGRMVFASGRFTILGGALLSSLDGLNWQQDAIGYNTSFNYVYAMSGRIWASGTLGEVYQTDLIGPVLAIRKLPATNGFEVTLTGSTGAVHHVQYSAYPTGPWLDSTVQTNINGTIIWTDTNSPTSGRYYRTLSP